ncbi:radical SAM protein [Stetteria hydrogenophila]
MPPYYWPPTLLARQALALAAIMDATGWRLSGRWRRDLGSLLKIAAGARKYGCFGYAPHPVFEVTARCNLRCIHCHADGGKGYPLGELDTQGAMRVIENLTTVKDFRMLVFTGGEPLVRRDFYQLSEYASSLGFSVVVATNGYFIDGKAARRMARSGVIGAAISLDSVKPEKHDAFRGVPGAWRAAVRAMRNVLDAGMYLQVNITISKFNIDEMEELVRFADKLGAHVVLLYTFVAVGRGEVYRRLSLTREDFARVIEAAARLQGEVELVISPIAAPWYYALLAKRARHIPLKVLERAVTGCIAARGMFYIKPNGDVWPCPFIPVTAGNVAEKPAIEIWNSDLFKRLRDRSNLGEPCRSCKYREVCGGCRARALIRTGDLFAGDPTCPLARDGRPPE